MTPSSPSSLPAWNGGEHWRPSCHPDDCPGALTSLLNPNPSPTPQTALERKMLEEAREARRREREGFASEVAAERRALALENAEAQRSLEANRAELLALKSRWAFRGEHKR